MVQEKKSIDGLEFEVLDRNFVVCRVYYKNGVRIVEYYGSKIDKCFCPLRDTDEGILEYIDDRVVPETRVNIKQILKSAGLAEYDALALFKIYKGMLNEDTYWVRFPEDGDMSYQEALHEVGRVGHE